MTDAHILYALVPHETPESDVEAAHEEGIPSA
ncbi:hypothetical protein HD592_000194 [Schaalia hyovaginalis]|uniref:Uncharacterized protein n=1 Tax=Schaalia hyovaginalis TaxID=29316 RepID=A0A923E4V8_9ACTO|nr:hypothetical protein [Schaalia hyovaginalis]